MGLVLKPADITTIHPLPSKAQEKPMLVQFAKTEVKRNVLANRKYLKGSNIYINEQLTKTRADIYWQARELKKKKLHSTWTYNGRIYYKLNEMQTNWS